MTAISQDVKDLVDAAKRRALNDLLGSLDVDLGRTLKSIDKRLEAIEKILDLQFGEPEPEAEGEPIQMRPVSPGTTDVKARFFLHPNLTWTGAESPELVWSGSTWVEVE